MYFWYIWQTYSAGISKKELTNVEIQEQTASFREIFPPFIAEKACENFGAKYCTQIIKFFFKKPILYAFLSILGIWGQVDLATCLMA